MLLRARTGRVRCRRRATSLATEPSEPRNTLSVGHPGAELSSQADVFDNNFSPSPTDRHAPIPKLGTEANEDLPRQASRGQELLEWSATPTYLRRIRRWRVPPHWSDRDWFEEIAAEATLAALQATRDFDPTRGVPWEAFLRQRVMHSALARYRREWTYATHWVSVATLDESGTVEGGGFPSSEAVFNLLQEALNRLPQTDVWLIEGLFWEGKTEARLAKVLGISQQAVSKRKKDILKNLSFLIKNILKISDLEL
jgi:RNA polymerase sigma factor (sigma-70 family)